MFVFRLIAVQLLFDSLEIGGMLVILDRGNIVGSHAVRTARKVLLEKFPTDIKEESTNSKLSFFIDPPKGRLRGMNIVLIQCLSSCIVQHHF